MQMPIVSMQKMSMTESVASTCCYRNVVTSSNHFTEVLFGGGIESGPHNTASWKPGIPTEWAQLPYDVDFSNYTGNTPVPYFNNLLGGWWVLYFDKGTIVYASAIDDLISDPSIPVSIANNGCTHSDNTCLYIDYREQSVELHVGATQPHKFGGTDFAKPHEAMQFSS